MSTRKRAIARGGRAAAAVPARGPLLTAAAKAVEQARAAASAGAPPTRRMHDARVALKRLRTYWRLARPHAAPAAWARERDRLRTLAAALAPFRDADAAQAAVAAHVGAPGDPAVRALLHRWIAAKRALAGPPAGRERALRAVARRLTGTVAKLERAGAGHPGFEWLEPGLARAYRRGRRAWRRRREGGSDLEFHTWRGRVKDLQYQIEMLRPVAPKRLRALHRGLRAAAEALGKAHDLVEVRDALERTFTPGGAGSSAASASRRRLREHLRRAIAAQYRLALAEAKAVYAPPPKDWLKRLREAWTHGHPPADVRRGRRRGAGQT